MPNKVCIELRPFDAITILCFLREYINEENNQIPELAALHECVDAYEKQIYAKLSNEMIEEAYLENAINDAAGRQPKREQP